MIKVIIGIAATFAILQNFEKAGTPGIELAVDSVLVFIGVQMVLALAVGILTAIFGNHGE